MLTHANEKWHEGRKKRWHAFTCVRTSMQMSNCDWSQITQRITYLTDFKENRNLPHRPHRFGKKNVLHNSYNVFYRWLKFLKIWISKSDLCTFFYFLYLISFSIFYISYIFLFFYFLLFISLQTIKLYFVLGVCMLLKHNFFLEIVKYK